ncbi:BREX-1 system adenine-specific DNA-methyltransferase PglX, partial [Anaerofustis stercorihominis]|uniref:BREX-1 system adenine-specific DNA-methyltransferase PglX n=1 Tax=Anaerofustis stercorihominis TaxID=214853 RepID=UPI001A9AE7CC
DPEILKFTNLMNPYLDINLKKEKYVELKDDNEKFKYVLLLVCKKLGRVIPQVFDGITDYIDILIPDNLLNDTGFITKVINEVPEKNYNQVEIIGWLYQYYNQTEKDRVISAKKSYKKNEIPYATQLFTPDWIVKYMVENSLGRYWVEHNGDGALYPSDNLYPSNNLYPSSSITSNWQYFIKDNIENKKDKLNPIEITFIDPCCGSGHILVYAFEVFYQMYLKSGFNKKDIPELILKNNLFGLDIDDRAGQLSILSVILKAREYDKEIFNKDIVQNLNIISIQESKKISDFIIDEIPLNAKQKVIKLLNCYINAKEYGSLLKIEKDDYTDLLNYINSEINLVTNILKSEIEPLIKQANIMSDKYDIVVTNPPYMGEKYFSPSLKKYIRTNYSIAKADMFTSFILVCQWLSKKESYIGMITPYAWMFLDSYKDLRQYLIYNLPISSLIQLEFNAFEVAALPVCTYVLKNTTDNLEGYYIKLSNFPGPENQPIKTIEALTKTNVDYKYKFKMRDFEKINDRPFAYWISDGYKKVFDKAILLKEYAIPRQGMATTDNKRFMRNWFEVDINNIKFYSKNSEEAKNSGKRWFPYNKGGKYRKWYGNNDFIVDYYNDGEELINLVREKYPNISDPEFVIKNRKSYFKSGITWTFISIDVGVRYFPNGFIFDVAGSSLFPKEDKLYYILGFMCSKLMKQFLQMLNPTMNVQAGNIANLPIIFKEEENEYITKLVKECIKISKEDWDSFELSWDFKIHPLVNKKVSTIKEAFNIWKSECDNRFKKIKYNEIQLNNKFVEIYGLQNDITNEILDKDITIKKSNKEREVKSLISYAVGCMFGRYSLDKEGLIYAGGDFDEIYKKHKKTDGGWAGVSLSNYKVLNDNGQEIDLSFEVDNDNVIPITDEAYFSDDIVERFKTFISVVYGEKTLNENLDFIAETLGKKGTETSEDTIRRYFVNDFFNDHVKTYQKRPIYWLFDSGKKNGFKALVYMHRYNENLIPKVRLDYLHRMQTTYEKLLTDVNDKLTSELSMTDKKEAQKRQADLNAKLQEIKEYDEKIAHIANQRISIDLDDGVKVNYDKFKDILAKIK